MFVPFAVLVFGYVINFVKKWVPEQILLITSITFVIFLGIWHITSSLPVSYDNNVVKDTNAILKTIEKYKPSNLYGSPYLTQGASYLSGVPIIDNLADTNAALFSAGKLNVDDISAKVMKSRTLVLMPARYTNNGNIEYPKSILSAEVIILCTVVHTQEFKWSGSQELHILKCYD